MTPEQEKAIRTLYYIAHSTFSDYAVYRIRGGIEAGFDTPEEAEAYIDEVVRAVAQRLAA